MSEPLDPEMQRVQIVIRPKFGTLTEEQRRDIVDAVRLTNVGMVRVDEAIFFNLGIGAGLGGIPITIDVWISVGAGTASGLLTLGIAKAVGPIVKILRAGMSRLVLVVRSDAEESSTYLVNNPHDDALSAVEAIPADFEVTTTMETRTRVWRDGRWEHYESTTRQERGTGAMS